MPIQTSRDYIQFLDKEIGNNMTHKLIEVNDDHELLSSLALIENTVETFLLSD